MLVMLAMLVGVPASEQQKKSTAVRQVPLQEDLGTVCSRIPLVFFLHCFFLPRNLGEDSYLL